MQGRTRTVLPFSTPTSMNNTDATDADAIWPNVPQQRQRHSRDHPNCSAWQGVTPGSRATRRKVGCSVQRKNWLAARTAITQFQLDGSPNRTCARHESSDGVHESATVDNRRFPAGVRLAAGFDFIRVSVVPGFAAEAPLYVSGRMKNVRLSAMNEHYSQFLYVRHQC